MNTKRKSKKPAVPSVPYVSRPRPIVNATHAVGGMFMDGAQIIGGVLEYATSAEDAAECMARMRLDTRFSGLKVRSLDGTFTALADEVTL
jgi:hypothetical protein